MANESLEKRVEELEEIDRSIQRKIKKTEKSLKHQIERLQAVNEIQNLMSKNSFLAWAGMHEEQLDLFARKTPGVRGEFETRGVYEGIEGLRKILVNEHQKIEGDRVGVMTVGLLTTPIIEVAGDGKTAKGVWFSPGIVTAPSPEGKVQAGWRWGRPAVDFVKEDGHWKIWHYHGFGMFMTSYEKSWAETALAAANRPRRPMPPMPDDTKPDRPNTYRWEYSPTNKTENIPIPPEPYETFDEKTAY